MGTLYQLAQRQLSLGPANLTETIQFDLNTLPDNYQVKRIYLIQQGLYTWNGAGLPAFTTDQLHQNALSVQFNWIESKVQCNHSSLELYQKFVQRYQTKLGMAMVPPALAPFQVAMTHITPIDYLPPLPGPLDWYAQIPTRRIKNNTIDVIFQLAPFMPNIVSFAGQAWLEFDLNVYDGEYIESAIEMKSVSAIPQDKLYIQGNVSQLLIRERTFTNLTIDGVYLNLTPQQIDRLSLQFWQTTRFDEADRTTLLNPLESTLGVAGAFAFQTAYDKRNHKLVTGGLNCSFTGLPQPNAGYILHRYGNELS